MEQILEEEDDNEGEIKPAAVQQPQNHNNMNQFLIHLYHNKKKVNQKTQVKVKKKKKAPSK